MKIELTDLPKEKVKQKIKPNLFYYQSDNHSYEYGYDSTVVVWGIEKYTFRPIWLGILHTKSASTFGAYGNACSILHKLFNYQWVNNRERYALKNKKIKLYQI